MRSKRSSLPMAATSLLLILLAGDDSHPPSSCNNPLFAGAFSSIASYSVKSATTSAPPPPSSSSSSSSVAPDPDATPDAAEVEVEVEVEDPPRPLLLEFKRGITKRIRRSREGSNRFGEVGAYTSEETIPFLHMRGSSSNGGGDDDDDDADVRNDVVSSRGAIRRAFAESSRSCGDGLCNSEENTTTGGDEKSTHRQQQHGRSSGSGCAIVRLSGSDAASILGLTRYADRFFERTDDVDHPNSERISNAGVFRIDDHVYAGFDDDVNGEGKMQFLDTRILPTNNGGNGVADESNPMLLPMEVGDLVGSESLGDAHGGMATLMDIGTQITSAVLDMDAASGGKLIDDGKIRQSESESEASSFGGMSASDVSNSYHRLIRYLKPQPSGDGTAFQAHVDSSFLTLIPMPELPGLEVWCPSTGARDAAAIDEDPRCGGGEWVTTPSLNGMKNSNEPDDGCAYVVVMAGEFLQLTSDGRVPVCIHRVIPPKAPSTNDVLGLDDDDVNDDKRRPGGEYRPRISAPMFLRPRRGEDAVLDVSEDLKLVGKRKEKRVAARAAGTEQHDLSAAEEALYFEEGLMEECDSMHLWSAHEIMMRR